MLLDADQTGLILAAEECPPEQFDAIHAFSRYDRYIITKLAAHGPVLLRGGRGSGKSALMMAASRTLAPDKPEASAIGVYLSLRYLPLLRSTGSEYERFFCDTLIDRVRSRAGAFGLSFSPEPTVAAVQRELGDLARSAGKRIVLFFDDAAHIGRETSLAEFFDLFRTLSSSSVSCKAAIYPGVTRFGTRFDVYNDATVVDIARNEDLPGFGEFFAEVFTKRYGEAVSHDRFQGQISRVDLAAFLGRAVLGNMRAFVFACNEIAQSDTTSPIGMGELTDVLLNLSSNYYWPLLEELQPKLGIYEQLVDPAKDLAEALFTKCGRSQPRPVRSVLVHREIIARLAKPFEILEYAGFLLRREVSRAMKSGGRGSRYALSLCGLLEQTPGTRLTHELYASWSAEKGEPLEFHRGSELATLALPELPQTADLAILKEPVTKLAQSRAYPYGLTQSKIESLGQAGIVTVGDLAEADDHRLLIIPYVGPASLQRFRNVVAQAVWM